jgi:two-component system, OmpR family, sensor histidine kinase MtrB
VILAFSVGALFLSLVLSLLVIGVTRTNLVNQRESNAAAQVYSNARQVRTRLVPGTDTLPLLESLQAPDGSRPSLFLSEAATDDEPGSGWTNVDPEYGQNALPEELRAQVLAGEASKMRFVHPVTGEKSLAIGTPIADIDGAYFEIASLEPIDDALASISFTLFGASIATVAAGAAFGWYSSRRILRPLGEVGNAARALAGGDLDTRIRTLVDPDLEPIISSFNGMADTVAARIEKDAQFASDVSHELRSPLMTLQASIEVLENNRDDLSERARSALDLLAADLDRFRQLVEDLLEISRFDAGVMHLDLQEVLVSEFVRYAVHDAGYSLPVLLDPGDEPDPELGDFVTALDKRRIARALANLLSNADKYGGGPTRVVVGGDEGVVRIMVDDSGEGVPPEDRERIFERFNRADEAKRRGTGTGVGLGLALVSEHVQLHGGHVSVDDAPGGGARFVISLPRVDLPHEEHEALAERADDDGARPAPDDEDALA